MKNSAIHIIIALMILALSLYFRQWFLDNALSILVLDAITAILLWFVIEKINNNDKSKTIFATYFITATIIVLMLTFPEKWGNVFWLIGMILISMWRWIKKNY